MKSRISIAGNLAWSQFATRTKCDANGCYIWQGTKDPHGYGRVTWQGRGRLAHRVALHVFSGFDLETALPVCHRCDVRNCVNPDHLYVGTKKQNTADMFNRGRAVRIAKLTDQQVADIRLIYSRAHGSYGTLAALARLCGVTSSTLHGILHDRYTQHAQRRVTK